MARNDLWLDEPEQAAWRGFLSMRSKLMSRLGRELQRQTGLSDADYTVLVELSEAPGERLRLGELGERLDWEKSRLSKQISRMSTRGLVGREECPTDARGAFAVLTKAGRKAIDIAAPVHVAHVRAWFVDALTPAQLDAMTAISTSVVNRLAERQAGDPSGKETSS
jgi:DNA-binding MarR family transcriptional regulator